MIPSDNSVRSTRRGAVLVLAALLMVGLFGFTAFVVDIGYIANTKAQMQVAADGAALASVTELAAASGAAAELTVSQAVLNAQQAATDVAAANPNGDSAATYLDVARDLRLGRREWDSISSVWTTVWGVPPYNLVEVTASRNSVDGTELPLFFAPVIGHDRSPLQVQAVATITPAAGFRYDSTSQHNIMILPFAVDVDTWHAVLDQTAGADNYSYDFVSESVQQIGDGVNELNLFPTGDGTVPGGNWGTVNLGALSNSTADISRQILTGLNDTDMSYFGGEIRTDTGPVIATGDPGISAAFEDEFLQIIGQTRYIPLFGDVSGFGGTATFTIVKFVGVRVMDARLTGSLSSKYVYVQPASVIDVTAIPSKYKISDDTVFSTATLVQ